MKGAVSSFQAHLCSSDGKLSNGAKIAAIYLVFTIHILRKLQTVCNNCFFFYSGQDHCHGNGVFVVTLWCT